MMRNTLKRCTIAALLLTAAGCGNKEKYPGPLTPEEALQSLHVIDGFKVELFAAEPLVTDPVSMEFDENGNCYVVVMSDYPDKPAPGQEKGHIRVLRDTDGDGRADTSIVFASKLSEGTSILPWKGGLLVTAAPEILYMKDTTGDFVADTREVLFSGFFKDNPETQITNLRFGVDNWIYANNRGQDGNVTFRDRPDAPPLSVKGADFRFRLDRGLFELETGPGQFGQVLDDYRNRFFTENSIHIQQMLIPWRYTHRHPYLPSTRAIRNISDHDPIMFQESPTPYWRAERTRRRNQEFQEKKLNRVEYERGHFTGASGGTFYNGDALPALYGNIFTGEVAGNLVHRDVLVTAPDSVHITAKRAAEEANREFIYSKDTWFRPVNFSVGPDGYLYVLDYYRQHIETPVSIPDDLKAEMDFYKGSDKGRIYRVMPINSAYKPAAPALGKMSSDSLVQLFAHPNQWYAQQAHRLLVERQDRSVVPALQTIVKEHADPRARLHALYVLEALNALDLAIVKRALADSASGVKEHAAMLAEQYPQCLPELLELAAKSPAKLALQATLSLGQFNDPRVINAFVQVLGRYGRIPAMQMAVLSSEAGSSPALLAALLDEPNPPRVLNPWRAVEDSTFLHDLAYVIGTRNNHAQVTQLMELLEQAGMNGNGQTAAVKGFTGGLQRAEGIAKTLKDQLKPFRSGRKTLADLKQLIATIN